MEGVDIQRSQGRPGAQAWGALDIHPFDYAPPHPAGRTAGRPASRPAGRRTQNNNPHIHENIRR